MNHPAAAAYMAFSGQNMAWFITLSGFAVFAFLIAKRFLLLKRGKPDPRFSDIGRRIAALIKDGFFQRRQPRYLFAGILHIVIFWGFLVLAWHSVELVVGGLWPGHVFGFMRGWPGVFYNSLKDLFSLIVLLASACAIYRRAVLKPPRYQGSHQVEAYIVLSLIGFLMITDITYEGSRLAAGTGQAGLLVAARFAKTILSGLSADFLVVVNHLSYWLHLLAFFFFLNLLPLSKHFHIVTALPNVFFKKLDNGAVKPPHWEIQDMDHLDEAGVNTLDDFTWKHMLDFYTCTECGRCSDNCPANALGKPLSPKTFTMTIRDFAYQNNRLSSNTNAANQSIPGEIIQDDIFWSCTTCGACEEECPVFIEYIDKMIELRRRRVLMESNFPPEIEQVYRNIETYGDAWGMGQASRCDWTRGLSVKTLQEEPRIDILFWVGCANAFDDRSQQTAISFVKILNKAGIRFGILGPEENCCGDYARRTGNEYLFQSLVKKNIETIHKYHIKKIVVACPHGFNTLKNEYPQFGADFEVVHATEYIHELLEKEKLSFTKELSGTVAYHDPCYLGRHNGIYEIPRKILSLVPGITMVEPEQKRERSFCCGAGGGHFWMESTGRRMNIERIDQMLEAEPEVIATGCPYCLIMLEDGIESKEMKGQIPVKDIMEIVADMI